MAEERVGVLGETERPELDRYTQCKLFNAAVKPGVKPHIRDKQRLLVIKEEIGPKKQRSMTLEQGEPQRPHIKEEADEVFIKQEEEDIIAVTVMSEDEENPEMLPFHQRLKEVMKGEGRDPEQGSSSRLDGYVGPENQKLIKKSSSGDLKLRSEEEEEAEITAVVVKSEEDEETSEFLHLNHSISDEGDDCSGPEPTRNRASEPGESSETDNSEDELQETSDSPSKKTAVDNAMGSNINDKQSFLEYHKRFVYESQLLRQLNNYSGGKLFSCFECGKRFTQKYDLRRHEKIHTGEKPYSCSVCGKRFSERVPLKTHERIHTGEKPFSCSVCGKRFTQSSNLRTHEKVHTGEKHFSCFECGKQFTHKSDLKRHEKFHTGEKPFDCPECGKKFAQKSDLRKHEKTHTGERPFSCSECGKCFMQKMYLVAHEKIHTGEKPYSCSACGQRFRQNGHLRKHIKIHTGEKPFSCTACDKRFTQKSSLKKHEKIHAREQTLSCQSGDSPERQGKVALQS